MSKKIIIGLIGLVIILAVGFVIYYVTSRQSPVANSEPSVKEEPLAKLIYVGTNETLSDALYHLDIQDGKVDEPHIVHKILEIDQNSDVSDIKKQALIFVGKGGKIEKEEVFESKTSKVIIYITQNGKYALVYSDYTSTGITYSYYDIKGNLLWKEKNTQNEYEVSPDGELVVEKTYDRDKRLSYYNILNPKKEMIKARFFEIDLLKYDQDKEVLFSPNAAYFALRYSGNNHSLVVLFNNEGGLLWTKIINGYALTSAGDKLSDQGDYYYLGYDPNIFDERIIVIDKKGKEIFDKRYPKKTALSRIEVIDQNVFCAIGEKTRITITLARKNPHYDKQKRKQ
jgi:hypothetical protein